MAANFYRILGDSVRMFVFVLIAFYFIDCSGRKTDAYDEKELLTSFELKNSPFIGVPVDLIIVEDNLYLSDFHGDTLVTEYDVEKQCVTKKLGLRGDGPSDITSPTALTVVGDTVYLFSKSSFKYGYCIPSQVANVASAPQYFFLYRAPTAVSEIIPIAGDQYLASGYFEQGRYAVLNENGEIIREFGDYPSFWKEEKNFPFSVKAMFHQVNFIKNDSLKKVAALSRSVLDIIDVSGSCFVKERVQLQSYNYVFSSGNMISANKTPETSIGAIHLTATENNIYLLFNPNKDKELKEPIELHVYDWDGVLQKRETLDLKIQLIVAKNDHLIYGISDDDEPKIVVYQR